MTDVEKLNETPVSQAILPLLANPFNPQYGPSKDRLYILQWLGEISSLAVSENLHEGLMTDGEEEVIASLQYNDPQEMKSLYKMLVPPDGESWSSNELIKQIERILPAPDRLTMRDQYPTEEEMTLLEMFLDNLRVNDGKYLDYYIL